MSDNVEIVNLSVVFQAIDDELEQLRARINDEIQAAGIECQAEAKQNAPVDTGRLRASIQYTPGILEATVGTNVEYAVFQEFGTRYMGARPFLLPAFELARRHLLDELGNL